MKIDSIKQLDKLLALCQKRGVTSITVDGISLQLMPHKQPTKRGMIQHDVFPEEVIKVPVYNPGNINESTAIETIDEETLTEEQLLYYSARPESLEVEQ